MLRGSRLNLSGDGTAFLHTGDSLVADNTRTLILNHLS